MIGIVQQITNRTYDYNLEDSQRRSSLISTSLETEYVPFYSIFIGEFKKIGDFRYNIYWLPPDIIGTIGVINRAITQLVYSLSPYIYVRAGITYYVMKHLIYTMIDGKPVILYTLGIKNNYWRTMNFENIDNSNLLIIVNSEFVKPAYASFYKYFTSHIINGALLSGIDIIHTNDITKYCFRVIETPLQFTTIADMKNYFSQITELAVDGIRNEAG